MRDKELIALAVSISNPALIQLLVNLIFNLIDS